MKISLLLYVQQNGTDQSECIEGNESIPCRTLSYVLNQINNRNNNIFGTSISVYVYITYYQEITNLSHIWLLVNLYLIGVDNPILDFSGGNYYDFSLQGGGSFYAENITFYDISGFCSLVAVNFNKCIFTSGGNAVTGTEGFYIGYTHNLIISNCLFHNNDARLELMVIQNALNVEISGCEFYQNTGQRYLIRVYPFYLELDNCSIYDNEVDYSNINMENYNSGYLNISNINFINNRGTGL